MKQFLQNDDVIVDVEVNTTTEARFGDPVSLSRNTHNRYTTALELTEQTLLSRQAERLLMAFENIREGLALYDHDERLVMMNARYAQMYAVPVEMQQPGTPFSGLITFWRDAGLMRSNESREARDEIGADGAGGSFRLHLDDGRVYEVNEQSLPGGGWVSTHEDITLRVAAERRSHYLARHDPLTGLNNRSAFEERLQSELGRHDSTDGFALMMLDLDRFKAVNDQYGHGAGDLVLIEVGSRVRAIIGPATMLARLGGDEFAILIPDVDRETVRALATQLVAAIRQPLTLDCATLELGLSIGVTYFPDHGLEASGLLKCADRALRAVKRLGKGAMIEYHPSLDAEESARGELTRRLPEALRNGEIQLHFQPIVDAASGACHTAEALLRWTHPERGRLSPELVISIAEESRQIGHLGDWILRKALATARTWPETIAVAVNLSASQFKDPGFAASVIAALAQSGIAPHRLELELTETVLCTSDALDAIRTLRAEGIRFSLDDFGTGYASMSYLLQFPFDRVKIDRSFVSDVNSRDDRRIIVEAVAGLAGKLGLEIVAEGVETDAERTAVRWAGCSFLQGYLLGRPMPETDFLMFVDRQL